MFCTFIELQVWVESCKVDAVLSDLWRNLVFSANGICSRIWLQKRSSAPGNTHSLQMTVRIIAMQLGLWQEVCSIDGRIVVTTLLFPVSREKSY